MPTQMDVEEAATIEYLRSMKLIRRTAPGRLLLFSIFISATNLIKSKDITVLTDK